MGEAWADAVTCGLCTADGEARRARQSLGMSLLHRPTPLPLRPVVVLWPGPSPTDAQRACHEYSRRMIHHGFAWHEEGEVPERDPGVLRFGERLLGAVARIPSCPAPPWHDHRAPLTIWGDVLTLRLARPEPSALAVIARLAAQRGMVAFELRTHTLLTPELISSAFGPPMLSLPPEEPLGARSSCRTRVRCGRELEVMVDELPFCSAPIDPTGVVRADDERALFARVLDMVGLDSLEDLQDRIEAQIEWEYEVAHGRSGDMWEEDLWDEDKWDENGVEDDGVEDD